MHTDRPGEYVETTLTALLNAIDEVARNDDEAFELLEYIVDCNRISLIHDARLRAS